MSGYGLPPSWFVAHTDDGEAYFYNDETGETSWDPPPGATPAGAAAAPSAPPASGHDSDDSDDWDVDDDEGEDNDDPATRGRRDSAFDKLLEKRQQDGTTQFAASMVALREQGVFGNRNQQEAIEQRSKRAFKNRRKSQFATSIKKLLPKLRAAGQFTPEREEVQPRPLQQVGSPGVDERELGSVSNRLQSLSVGGMDTNVGAPSISAVHGEAPNPAADYPVAGRAAQAAAPAAQGEVADGYVNDEAAALLFGGPAPATTPEAATELGWSPEAADHVAQNHVQEEEDEPTHGWEPVEYQVVSFICYEYTDPATQALTPVELPLFGSAGSLELGLAVVAFEGLVLLGPRDDDEPVVIPYDKMLFWTVTTNFGPNMSDHFVDMTMDATYDPTMRTISWWTGHVLELRCCLADEETANGFSASLKAVCERVREVGMHQVDTAGMKNSRVARASIMSGKPSITAGMSARQRRATITEAVQREDRMAQGFLSDDLGSLLGGGGGGPDAAPDGQPRHPTKKKFSMRRALGLRRHSKHDF